MRANIKLEFKTMTPAKLCLMMGVVHGRMMDNVHFPAPPVSMADLAAKQEVLIAAVNEAIDGSRLSKMIRDKVVLEGQQMLRQLAGYVRMVAQGDGVILSSSGFEMARVPHPVGVVEAPKFVEVHTGDGFGEVKLRWSGVRGRHGYQVYMGEQDPTTGNMQWILVAPTGKVWHTISGLEQFKQYWFCVSAVGAEGEGPRSNPVMGMAL